MKKIKYLLTALICLASLIIIPSASESKPAETGKFKPVPIIVKGKTIEIQKGINRAEIKKSLSGIFTEEASIDSEVRLQYDVILVEGQAPATVIFDFNKKGTVTGIIIDAYTIEQNPPVTALLKWLDANAGKPKVNKKKGTKTWIYGGWKIEHTNSGSGEDSAYRVDFTLQ